MTLLSKLGRLRGDRRGAAIIEFALLVPIVLTAMFGVFQFGLSMWRYNALRSLSADIARYAMVEYQSDEGVDPSTTTIQNWGIAKGTSDKYKIPNSDLTVNVTTATTRVTGAVEMTITVTSAVPSLVPLSALHGVTISYTRPVFLLP
jgi:Flp pilus assembly protein TadG